MKEKQVKCEDLGEPHSIQLLTFPSVSDDHRAIQVKSVHSLGKGKEKLVMFWLRQENPPPRSSLHPPILYKKGVIWPQVGFFKFFFPLDAKN